MTNEEIDLLTEAQAKSKLKQFYQNPLADFYLALKMQIDSIAQQLYDLDFSITDKDQKHVTDLITDLGEKGLKIKDTLKGLLGDIDIEALNRAIAEKTKASRGSLEDRIKQGKK